MFFRGRDDLTKEIDEFYGSRGYRRQYKDPWEIDGSEGKKHSKHSVGVEIAESERKQYVDHSSHSMSDEIAESSKKSTRRYRADTYNRTASPKKKKGIIRAVIIIFLISFIRDVASSDLPDRIFNKINEKITHSVKADKEIMLVHINEYYELWDTEDDELIDALYETDGTYFAIMDNADALNALIQKGIVDLDSMYMRVYSDTFKATITFTYDGNEKDRMEIAECLSDLHKSAGEYNDVLIDAIVINSTDKKTTNFELGSSHLILTVPMDFYSNIS